MLHNRLRSAEGIASYPEYGSISAPEHPCGIGQYIRPPFEDKRNYTAWTHDFVNRPSIMLNAVDHFVSTRS
jgi:hypothetical protein